MKIRLGEQPVAGRDAQAPLTGAEPPAGPGPQDLPAIPEAVRIAAAQAPGHWIGVVDPEWTAERTPPEWAVAGEWRSQDSGEVGTYRPNPAYRPSARVLGWPEPTDPVDAAAQRAATGYGSDQEAVAALAEAEITVVAGPDGGPLLAAGRDGAPVVLVFTAPQHAFTSPVLRHDTLSARELARSLPGAGTQLLVNSGAAAPLLVPADQLRGDGPTATDHDPAARGGGGPAEPADGTGSPAAPSSHTSRRSP
ncbi:type VII secretion system-associated protein [Streptomyces sp. NPDC058373]|uniref:type VII secretion system-associated protein n=1 Tax=Streptomyces sp. NPDC058373 TaxID=3346465 RepID=UPI00364EA13D